MEASRVHLCIGLWPHHLFVGDEASLRWAADRSFWAAAGSVDTDLSFLSFLELYGTEIAERRMPARRVVEALDVVEHI